MKRRASTLPTITRLTRSASHSAWLPAFTVAGIAGSAIWNTMVIEPMSSFSQQRNRYCFLRRASASMRACLTRISAGQALLMNAKDAAISSSVRRCSNAGMSPWYPAA